jgi:thiamine-monophosphate kinase
MTSEFKLIEDYFTRQPVARDDVVLGVGDDGAILRPRAGLDVVVTTDTLVEGVHFVRDMAPRDLGYRALAVNLSDLAAMGAEPAWATLALTVPFDDAAWFAEFSAGFFELSGAHRVQLVGGNMARGPLSITVTVHGYVPPRGALRRDGARPGDLVFVTGTLGDAALGLRLAQASRAADDGARQLLLRYARPTPRIAEGLQLRGIASACIDVSDGLLADLGHILERSHAGATLRLDDLPRSAAMRRVWDGDWSVPLAGGDDYELCFTAPAERATNVRNRIGATCIGTIDAAAGLRCMRGDGTQWTPAARGYDHFA